MATAAQRRAVMHGMSDAGGRQHADGGIDGGRWRAGRVAAHDGSGGRTAGRTLGICIKYCARQCH
uniref:Uncharacterized protein n=1 Tax=Oryza meridionalis TaxID=40149 RepID=A0A0E0EQS0_9ORYZ